MKTINHYISTLLFATLLISAGCNEDNYELGTLKAPGNLGLTYEIVGQDEDNPYGDGSGAVTFTASANDQITFNYLFGDGKDNKVAPDGKVTHVFTKTGVHTYIVTVTAVGTGGVSSTKSVSVEVFSSFRDDEAEEFLTGGSSKKWYWAADQPGHVGLGPNFIDDGSNHTFAAWYSAAPFEKTCMYNDVFEFTKTPDGLTFEQTAGPAYIPGTYAGKIGVQGDQCYGQDVVPGLYGVKNVSFGPASTIATKTGHYRGTTMSFSDGGFMGWYVGKSEYEIIQITDNILKVRVEEDATFAWYQIYTSVKPKEKSDELDVEYNNLVWADEFETDGTPDAANWSYDLGAGGWGNGEVQTYTNSAENVSVSDGTLKITAKADGDAYTSARIKTQGLQEFMYGRIEVRAKLPQGGGTWPAIWMLGANFEMAGWPACGELDIMEAVGNNPGYVQCAVHTPSSYGNTQNMASTTVANASSEFHVYSMNWSADQISFLIDEEIYYTYAPENKNTDTWPFDAKQFIILNVAMGGNLGGEIDPAFTESAMEVDYVRVYQ